MLKAFALARRDVTPADDFVSLYGYELNRRMLAEKGVDVLQRRRLEKGQPPSLSRDRIKTPPEALRVLRGASSHRHVGELVRRRNSPLALCNGWALSYGRPCCSQVSTGGRPGSTANRADAGPGRMRGNQSGRAAAAPRQAAGSMVTLSGTRKLSGQRVSMEARAPLSDAKRRTAPRRSAPERQAALRFAARRSAPRSEADDRLARAKLHRRRLALRRSA